MPVAILGFLYGLILGSFAKCIADRSVTKQPFTGRSECPNCGYQLKILDLIPILSFALSKGKCTNCQKKISLSYPLVEIVCALLISTLFVFQLPSDILTNINLTSSLTLVEVLFKSLAIVVFIAVFLTDISTGLIPNRITYPAIILAVVYLATYTIAKIAVLYIYLSESNFTKLLLPPHSDYFYRHSLLATEPLTQAIFASVVIGLFFLILILATRGKGMGGGDLKLGMFMGLVLGIYGSLEALVVAFISGSIVGLALIVTKKKNFGQTIPFGPFLSIGSTTAIIWGNQITDWYLKFRFPIT